MATLEAQEIRSKAKNIVSAAKQMADRMIAGSETTRAQINKCMESAFRCNDADGAWRQKDGFTMLEIANIFAHKSKSHYPSYYKETAGINALVERISTQPTHRVRSETQIELQQFSTPMAIAAMVWTAANARHGESILEPSAGIGMLAQFAYEENFRVTLNEIDPLRAELLKLIFPNTPTTSYDAATLDAVMSEKFDIIIMNPPFSREQGRYDRNTALRHLIAACRCLKNKGRIVAIMPPNFGKTKDEILRFNKITENVQIRAIAWMKDGFIKHGTGVETKLVIIDHCKAIMPFHEIKTNNINDILTALKNIQREPIVTEAKLETLNKPKSLFAAFKQTEKVITYREITTIENVTDVNYTTKQEKEKLEPVGQYLPYRPSVITIDNAQTHPSKLVESIAMGSISAPVPTYKPKLLSNIISDGILSEAQLETLIYAGEATEYYLRGKFSKDAKHIMLKEDANGHDYRAGFFLGDGTGAGKGRQIAGIILDQWLRNNRKHIWITENAPLLEDARRDWNALGGVALDIQPLSNWKPGQKITMGQGILFATYATIRNSTSDGSRLNQILDWAQDDFSGAIIFDEAHAMGGVAGGETGYGEKKGSLQGLTGVRLQNALPEARVIYSSATGASDINNLAYATRLGLWGPGTEFATRDNFISDIRSNGIAAMEVVARELKGQGRYIARSLSYEGIEYDILEHKLDKYQIRDFNLFADAWSIIHRNVEKAMEVSNIKDAATGQTLNGRALGVARSRFESCKQRFFNQVLLTMKLPSVIPAINKAIDDGNSVVIQLVTTAEAMLDRQLENLTAEERANLDIILSPTEYMIDYLKNAFPTTQMRTYADEEGKLRSEPVRDANGNHIQSQAAIKMRDDLIETLFALPQMGSALDGIIHHFGTDQVAEVTGRSRRLIIDSRGQQRVESRSARSNIAETQAFMNGNKRILVFSDAGGTGRSYHASCDAQNQQRRVHFLLEPGWRADKAIQGLGRTNRTHQASAPIFRPVTTDCRGERRFISTIARRLDTLGALTKGQRQTGGQNLFNPADNLESEYAIAALTSWCNLLIKDRLTSTTRSNFEEQTGLEMTNNETGDSSFPSIQKWLNRILAMRIETQNAIFDEFTGLVEERIETARKAGTLDIGLESINVKKLTIIDRKILRTDERTKATTQLVSAEIQYLKRITDVEAILELAKRYNNHCRYLMNEKSGNPALLTPSNGYLDFDGNYISRFRLTRPTARSVVSETEIKETGWKTVTRNNFIQLWTAKCSEEATTTRTELIHIVTGQLLPIWNKISSEHSVVRRIITPEGTSILGRVIDPSKVSKLCLDFKIEPQTNLSNEKIIQFAVAGQHIALTPDNRFPHIIERRIVNGQQRIEIRDYDAHRLSFYKSLGCFTEIIASKTRLFVPTEIIAKIITEIKRL
jgi:predicted RNA methylase